MTGPLNSAKPTTSQVVGGVYNGSAPAPADQQAVALQMDNEGNLLVNVAVGGGGSNASVGPTGATAPANATEEGLVANVGSSLPTAVTNGQLVGAMGDKFGREIALLNGHRSLLGTAAVQNTGTSGTLIASGGTGVYTDIISLVLTNESASTATVVSISDGTTTYKIALAAGGGAVINFPTPLPAASSATAWTISNSGSVNVDAIVIYIKNK